jgi:hypothetical protein
MRRTLLWSAIAALIVLAARSLSYALGPPTPLAVTLEHQAGGPQLVVVTLVSLAIAIAVAAGILWLAAVGVRERHQLSGERGASPSLPLVSIGRRALLLWLASSAAFTLFESYVHWRAGLGYHGLSCLVGPVHRDAVPVLAALSLLAVAAQGSVAHVLSWMRRTLRMLLRTPRHTVARRPAVVAPVRSQLVRSYVSRVYAARGPPVIDTA